MGRNLGQYYVQYATNTLSRFEQKQRELHMNKDFRMFGYLKHHLQANIYFNVQKSNT